MSDAVTNAIPTILTWNAAATKFIKAAHLHTLLSFLVNEISNFTQLFIFGISIMGKFLYLNSIKNKPLRILVRLKCTLTQVGVPDTNIVTWTK